MSDHEPEGGKPKAEAEQKRKPRVDKRVVTARIDRRAAQIEETLKELVGWFRIGWADGEQLPLLETIERDARRIGTGLAAVGERINPFGTLLDAVFGLTGPLAIVVALGPTIRAGYRDAREKIERRKQRRQERAQQTEGLAQEGLDGLAEERPDLYDASLPDADRRAGWEGDPAAAGVNE